MIISGNKIANTLRDELKETRIKESNSLMLHIFIIGNNPVIENFVMKKRHFAEAVGVQFIEHRLVESSTTQQLITAITKEVPKNAGIVVQLPLPKHIDTEVVLAAIPIEADIDGLAPDSPYTPPVAGAVQELFARKGISIAHKRALVIGKGRLVGEPVAKLLAELGAKVTIVDKTTTHEALTALTKTANIIVSGAGVPNLITPDMITERVTLIDAGTSTQAGAVVGDIAYDCKDKARYFARTPGGVGPITVAVLFKNLIYGTIAGTRDGSCSGSSVG